MQHEEASHRPVQIRIQDMPQMKTIKLIINLSLHFKMHGGVCRHFKPRRMITLKLRLDLPPIITEQDAW
jgi:hypothetical protein